MSSNTQICMDLRYSLRFLMDDLPLGFLPFGSGIHLNSMNCQPDRVSKPASKRLPAPNKNVTVHGHCRSILRIESVRRGKMVQLFLCCPSIGTRDRNSRRQLRLQDERGPQDAPLGKLSDILFFEPKPSTVTQKQPERKLARAIKNLLTWRPRINTPVE